MAPYHTTIVGEAGAIAAAQVEKVLHDVEVPEKEKFVNEADAKVLAGPEKKKWRQRQRKRKMQANSQEAPAATPAMKQQGMISTDDLHTTYICNLLKQAEKQVKCLVKETFEKIASKAVCVTEGKRTPKIIIGWRAQVPNPDLKRIAKLRSQLAHEAVPDGTTAVSFTLA